MGKKLIIEETEFVEIHVFVGYNFLAQEGMTCKKV